MLALGLKRLVGPSPKRGRQRQRRCMCRRSPGSCERCVQIPQRLPGSDTTRTHPRARSMRSERSLERRGSLKEPSVRIVLVA